MAAARGWQFGGAALEAVRMNRLLALAFLVLVSSTGCTLRPRYLDLVTPDVKAKTLRVQMVERYGVNAPIAGAKVEIGEGKNKVTATTGADGTFELPVTGPLSTDNPVFVVTLPAGVESYRLELAPLPVLAPPPAVEPVKAPEAAEPRQVEPNRVTIDGVQEGNKTP